MPNRKRPKTATEQERFLAAYIAHGYVTVAADAIGIHESYHYRWLRSDPEYRERFADAENRAVERLLAETRRRGLDGYDEPIIYQGSLCYPVAADGKPSTKPLAIRKYSDNLLMFLIKQKRPEFRDTWKGELHHSGMIAVPTLDVRNLSDEQLGQLSALLQAAGLGDPGEPRALLPGGEDGRGETVEREDP